jgi:uncharacterized protein YdbL (DUF1318 family)
MRTLTAFLFAVAVAVGLQASAQGLGEIKQRMKDRLDEIETLKIAKTVGEDKNGYLQVLGDISAASKTVVEAENADRKLVYTAIAAKTGASAETVGQSRAKIIANSAAPGIMLQAPDGSWYEKK